MDELTMFAELRPNDRLTDAELDDLRAELFPDIAPTKRHAHESTREISAGDVVSVQQDIQPAADSGGPRRSRFALAAAVAAMGLGGLWVVADRESGPDTNLPATQPERSASIAHSPPTLGIYDVPLVGFAEPGWTVTSAYDNVFPTNRSVVLLSDLGFDGPWVEITADARGTTTASTEPSSDGTVEIDGTTAQVTEIENGVILRWSDAAGNAMQAFGWQVDRDQVTALLGQATVTDTGITIDDLAPGASVADPAASQALGHHAEYRFTHRDGREIQVSFQPGGARGRYQREGPTADFNHEGRTTVMVGDEQATIIDYNEFAADPTAGVDPDTSQNVESPGGEYRLDLQRGFWTWEFNTTRFDSEQQVIDLVAGATVVDGNTWRASLADSIIDPDERSQAIAEVLAEVPLPPGFAPGSLGDGGTNDRYQFIAEISGAVACGWFEEWFVGESSGNAARQNDAAAALATSHDWPMLQEIVDQGDWSEVLWAYADNINGTSEVLEATRSSVTDGLGCN